MMGSLLPPTAVIAGPQLVSRSCDFTLDASKSFDAGSNTSQLVFDWSCKLEYPTGIPDACAFLSNFADGNSSREDGWGVSGRLFHVASGQLTAGLYLFSVSVSRFHGASDDDTGTATFYLQVDEGDVPPIQVKSPWEDMERVSVSSEMGAPLVSAVVRGSPRLGCSVPEEWAWQWVLVQLASSEPLVLAALSSQESRTTSKVEELFRLSTSDLRGQLLVPGQAYKYALLQADEPFSMALVLEALGAPQVGAYNFSNYTAFLDQLTTAVSSGGLPIHTLALANVSVAALTPAF
jgi:hypothetical protein